MLQVRPEVPAVPPSTALLSHSPDTPQLCTAA